jgi:hypothetical protein
MVPGCASLVAGLRPKDYKRTMGVEMGAQRAWGARQAGLIPSRTLTASWARQRPPWGCGPFMPCSQFAPLSVPNPSLISSPLASTPSWRHDDRPERAPGQARHCRLVLLPCCSAGVPGGTHLPHPMPLTPAAGC